MTGNLLPHDPAHESPFQQIRRVNDAGNEFWSSRDFATILGYTDYRNFEQVIAKAKTACFNSGMRMTTISLTSPKWSPLAVAPNAQSPQSFLRATPATS